MTNYLLDPKKYNFNASEQYSEVSDFFSSNAFVKVIAMNGNHCWYTAIKIIDTFGESRYNIYKGVFTKKKEITTREYPERIYFGLISNEAFAESLLKHLMGTLNNSSVEKEGLERLQSKCLYLTD